MRVSLFVIAANTTWAFKVVDVSLQIRNREEESPASKPQSLFARKNLCSFIFVLCSHA